MSRARSFSIVFISLGAMFPLWEIAAQAQEAAPKVASAQPAVEKPASLGSPRYRRLAPGIETTIPVDRHESETYSKHDMVEIIKGNVVDLDWKPHASGETTPEKKDHASGYTLGDLCKNCMYRKDVWNLEFTFKPMRMIWVDIPQKGGRLEHKLVYYLVYRVRNPGNNMHPVRQEDGTYKIELVDKPPVITPTDPKFITFRPVFSLENRDRKKAYLDRILPTAISEIQRREDPNRKLLNSVEISWQPLEVSKNGEDTSVWGVATWENIDPTLDSFQVVIEGLSNAQRWTDPEGAFKPGSPPGTGRTFTHKMLALNFWRPGDEFLTDERTIHFGIPGQIDFRWIYR